MCGGPDFWIVGTAGKRASAAALLKSYHSVYAINGSVDDMLPPSKDVPAV